MKDLEFHVTRLTDDAAAEVYNLSPFRKSSSEMSCSTKRILFAICQINILALCFAQKYPGDICTTTDKRDGICRTIDQCETARKELRRGKMPVTCDFEGSSPFVCCPEEVEPPITQPSKEPGEAASYWCGEYIKTCPRRKGIAGGVRALPSEFPHMAAIGVGDESNTQWFCGGTLISETFVMTAAHCLNSGNRGPARWVLLGTESTVSNNNAEGRKGQIHPVVRRIRHPDYKPPSKYHDVALLEIGPAITPGAIPTVSKLLHPACLPTTNRNYTLFRAIATGWGRTGHAEDGSPELLKVELNIFEVSKCNETFDVEIRTTDWLNRGIDDTMLCAGVLEGGKDTCQGDSGGPLQFPIRNYCMYEVWGITSFGKSCAFANSPAIYTRVSDYVQWIEKIVWP